MHCPRPFTKTKTRNINSAFISVYYIKSSHFKFKLPRFETTLLQTLLFIFRIEWKKNKEKSSSAVAVKRHLIHMQHIEIIIIIII